MWLPALESLFYQHFLIKIVNEEGHELILIGSSEIISLQRGK